MTRKKESNCDSRKTSRGIFISNSDGVTKYTRKKFDAFFKIFFCKSFTKSELRFDKRGIISDFILLRKNTPVIAFNEDYHLGTQMTKN